MSWNDLYPKASPPNLAAVSSYINNRLWKELCDHLESSYGVSPALEHSICSGAPGWNVKYKKSGRALCTLYPAEGTFTCLVSVVSKEAMEAELLLGGCTEYLQALYWNAKPFNGSRWLMIEVTSAEVLEDVTMLIGLRMRKRR